MVNQYEPLLYTVIEPKFELTTLLAAPSIVSDPNPSTVILCVPALPDSSLMISVLFAIELAVGNVTVLPELRAMYATR